MFDYLIVGAGVAGCVLAERLAYFGKSVLLVEKRNHIAGNAYDEYNTDGILVHRYGPHIFHTNSPAIWSHLSTFTEWNYYQHRVSSYVDGMFVPFPINLDTINQLLNEHFSVSELEFFMERARNNAGIKRIANARDMAVSLVGQDLYDKFFRHYTEKQWGLPPEQLGPEVTGRIPVRPGRETRYFTDRYQGVPRYGYTRMFQRMLDHPGIQVLLNADYKKLTGDLKFNRMVYTGPIDCFFDHVHGPLPYRGLCFEYETLPVEYYQETATVNYPNDYDFTRITEFKHLTGQKHPCTTIAREYPEADGEPFYPVPNEANLELYRRYEAEARHLKSVFFVGRLAEYRYYSMDQVIERALSCLEEIMN